MRFDRERRCSKLAEGQDRKLEELGDRENRSTRTFEVYEDYVVVREVLLFRAKASL